MVRASVIALSLTLLLRGCVPSCTPPEQARFAPVVVPPADSAHWTEVVDAMRLAVGVLPVDQSAAGARYARAAAACLAHSGQPGNPHTLDPALDCGPAVDAAAARVGAAGSLIAFAPSPLMPRKVIERLANAPFHAMALFDPALKVVDYGDAYDPLSPGGRNVFTAAIWVHGARQAGRVAYVGTVMWPPPGWPVPGLMRTADEWPSPLWECGLATSGPPIWMAHPGTRVPPLLTDPVLTGPGGEVVPLCSYNADDMHTGDPVAVALAADYMRRMGAVVLVPTTPLGAGEWRLTGTLDGRPFERSLLSTG
jgi:hypothetical protein